MKKKLSEILFYLLGKVGLTIKESTSRDKITKLIESLYPYQTQFDLIRLGSNEDGGYLVPNDLEGVEACFSPGVDLANGFEYDCLKYGMNIYMADKSVEKPNLDVPEEKYNFIKKFIGATNNDDYITMDSWVTSSCPSDHSDLILQMDIERAEYNVIINMSDAVIKRFRIMVIEFHSLDSLHCQQLFDLFKTVFDKILQTHICVHIHPNNDCGIDSRLGIDIPRIAEFTFIRKDRVKTKNYASHFPHQLDFDNTSEKSILLPKNWYKSTL